MLGQVHDHIVSELGESSRTDVIFVLKEGRVVERGGYAALYALNGEFTRMVDAQSAAPDEGSSAEVESPGR